MIHSNTKNKNIIVNLISANRTLKNIINFDECIVDFNRTTESTVRNRREYEISSRIIMLISQSESIFFLISIKGNVCVCVPSNLRSGGRDGTIERNEKYTYIWQNGEFIVLTTSVIN